MADPAEKERLKALEARIARVKKAEKPEPKMDDHYSGAAQAWRMVIELVAGIVIGFGIGFGLDWLFGTMPLFLVVFILIGFAAGVKTMMRTAGEAQEQAARADREKEEG